MILLKLGSKGEQVKKVQKFLGFLLLDGIYGPKTEAAVKKWQSKNGLKADGIVGDKTWNKMFPSSNEPIDPSVSYNPIEVHITRSENRSIKYLVIHYTAGAKSSSGTALSTRNVFIRRSSSADFIVDDTTLLQVNPDPSNFYTWAVGDGKGKYGITNRNSVSIEICSSLKKGYSAKYPNHDGWYFTDQSLNNAVKLAKIIMKKFNIPLTNVVRHYDASHKLCPGIIGWNPGSILDNKTGKSTGKNSTESGWIKFKNRLI